MPYTGPRIGEALRLAWADIDRQAGLVRVHREHAPLKTEAGRREVILAPTLAKSLRERWLASRYKAPRDFIFGNTLGGGLDYRDVSEAFRQAIKRAGLEAPGKLTLHSLRHGLAARPRESQHHPGGLRAPVRAGRPRHGRAAGARGELRGDGERPLTPNQ